MTVVVLVLVLVQDEAAQVLIKVLALELWRELSRQIDTVAEPARLGFSAPSPWSVSAPSVS